MKRFVRNISTCEHAATDRREVQKEKKKKEKGKQNKSKEVKCSSQSFWIWLWLWLSTWFVEVFVQPNTASLRLVK